MSKKTKTPPNAYMAETPEPLVGGSPALSNDVVMPPLPKREAEKKVQSHNSNDWMLVSRSSGLAPGEWRETHAMRLTPTRAMVRETYVTETGSVSVSIEVIDRCRIASGPNGTGRLLPG